MDIPKWIVTDLDETLLRNDSTVSSFTISTLDRIRDAGSKFAIATTRYKAFAQPFIDMLRPDAIVVCGGALGIVDLEMVHCQIMDPTHLHALLQDLEKLPAGRRPAVIDSSQGRFGDKQPIEKPFMHDAYQVILWSNSTLPPTFIDYWSQFFLITPLWVPGLYRIGCFKANKLDALKAILMDVDPACVWTFGDDPMDAGMLAHYQGVAVANAKKEAREAARYHTASNEEDGVARWIAGQFLS